MCLIAAETLVVWHKTPLKYPPPPWIFNLCASTVLQ